jgi:hypothetical protein
VMASLRHRPAAASAAAAPTPAEGSPAPPKRSIVRRGCSGCCRLLTWTAYLLLALYAASVGSALLDGKLLEQAARHPYAAVNFAMMKFFRDLSRSKARRRRFDQKNALMTILLSHEAPLPLADVDGEGRVALTAEELAEYDGRQLPGSDERAPLYLSILGCAAGTRLLSPLPSRRLSGIRLRARAAASTT